MSGYHHLHVIVCHIDEDSVRRKTGVTLASALRLSDWEVVRRPCVKSMSAILNCLILELMVVRKREMVICCASQWTSLRSLEQDKSIQ